MNKTLAKIEQEMKAEQNRRMRWVVALIEKHPEYRDHIACALLADGVAYADSFGVDVEGWLAELRAQAPRPAVLSPPTSRQS